MRIARRLSQITASPTMVVMQEAQELRARGVEVIDLGPGQPDFPTPDSIKQAGFDAIQANFTTYTPSAGVNELREAVAQKYNQEWGTSFRASNVIITCGAKHAIYDLCMTVFDEGEEVLNPAPYWVTFPEVVKLSGAVPVDVPTREEDDFILSAADVEGALTPRSTGLIVNTPCNPTGAMVPRRNIGEIVEVARPRQLFLLFDETYEHFTYGDHGHCSLAAFLGADHHGYAIVGSFSKTYSMTGWRVGYCVGHAEIISKIDEFQSHQTGNPTSISQKAALAALKQGTAEFERMRKEYHRRRDFVLGEMGRIPGFSCVRPEGAFYVFPNVSRCIESVGCGDSVGFSRFLLQEARVATVPGSAFGAEGFIRISYATSMENLREGLHRIRESVSRVS
jgi:aspartate aminotransferase